MVGAEPADQRPIQSSPYQSPMYNYAGSIVLLTNPDDEIGKFELFLRNVVVNAKGKVTSSGKPLCNEDGIRSLLGIIQSAVNRVTVLSNLDSKERDAIRNLLADTLAKDLMLNRSTYEIENESARDRIYDTAIARFVITMNRAKDEGERKFWKGSQQEIITHGGGQQGKKAGFWRQLTNWG